MKRAAVVLDPHGDANCCIGWYHCCHLEIRCDSIPVARVKLRQFIDTFFERIRLFLVPVFHRLKGWNMAQGLLGNVLIIDLDVAFDGVGQVLGGVECGI